MASVALALWQEASLSVSAFRSFWSSDSCWVVAVYVPLAQWLWGGGWLTRLGSLDFAGGAVIHISAGVTALVMAITDRTAERVWTIDMMPNHLPFSFCGAGVHVGGLVRIHRRLRTIFRWRG